MTTRFDSKDPAEGITIGFDFRAFGGNPSNPQVTIAVHRGEDPDPGPILVGSPVVIGDWVYQRASGGIDGVDYTVRCLADVGPDRPLIDAILPVRTSPRPA